MRVSNVAVSAQVLLSLVLLASVIDVATYAEELVGETETFREAFPSDVSLDQLEEAARVAPNDYRIQKLRGDLLTTLRRNQEALTAYRQAAALNPDALEVHWALWGLVGRIGTREEALTSLREIVRLDGENPLAHLRLARALHALDRLEESIPSFQRAVELNPEQHVYRLLLGRALHDILMYQAARREVETVLNLAPKGSPVWGAAKNLYVTVKGESLDKGLRDDFNKHLQTPGVNAYEHGRAWTFAREKAWRHMKAGQFAEAEKVLKEVLVIKPDDHKAHYDLGISLMELNRWEEAIGSFQQSIQANKYSEVYADSVYQQGRCYAMLGRWAEAIPKYLRVLEIQDWEEEYFYALNFPYLPKVQEALAEARRHAGVSDQELSPQLKSDAGMDSLKPLEYPLPPLAEGQDMKLSIPIQSDFTPIDPGNSNSGFAQIIVSKEVVRDDLQTGQHEFLPINPHDTFLPVERLIYVVFMLRTSSSNETILTSRWVAERTSGLPPNTVLGTDTVAMGLNERSGFFQFERPEGGWKSGTYRVDFFLGEEVNSYSHMADVRFQVRSASTTSHTSGKASMPPIKSRKEP